MKLEKVTDPEKQGDLVGALLNAHVWVNEFWMLYCGNQLSYEFENKLIVSISQLGFNDQKRTVRTLYPYVVVEHDNQKAREDLAFSVACVFISNMLKLDASDFSGVKRIPIAFTEEFGRLLVDGYTTYCELDIEKMKESATCES